ncbi:MAG: Uma2 family endonuclease [Chloroflexota bacterium]
MSVQDRVGMPLDEFIELGNEHPFEIINGERIPKLPTVGGHNYVIRLLFRLLSLHSQIGECFIEATYVLPDHYDSTWVSGSRTPDLLFITAERWTAYLEANPDWKQKPYLFVPDLVIEVISPTDKFTEVNNKVDAYLADGVRLIILIDPQRREAFVHAPDAEQPLHLSGDAQIDLSDVLPDLKIALPSLFE